MSTVLIIDDDPVMREALAEAVRDLGHTAHLAPSGEAALALLERESVNAVFLDLRMPGMNGLELTQKLKANGVNVPIILITARQSSELALQAVDEGA